LEIGRAVWHSCLISVWAVHGLAYKLDGCLVWVAFFSMVVWEILRRRYPVLSRYGFVRFVIREKELKGEITSATLLLLALLLIVNCFDKAVVSSAILITALADPAARIVGISIGKHKIGSMKKTWEGTIACFLVAFAIVLVMQTQFHSVTVGVAVALAAFTGLAAVVAELVIPHLAPNFLDDNFWIPFLTGAALQLARMILLNEPAP